MIALILAAQVLTQPLVAPRALGSPIPQVPASEIIRTLPSNGLCAAGPARLEVSLAQPTALYRRGDRSPRTLRDWVSYPNPRLCLVEAQP